LSTHLFTSAALAAVAAVATLAALADENYIWRWYTKYSNEGVSINDSYHCLK
jgi:hypothetical protein